MSDTQSTWSVRDGRGRLRQADINVDASGNVIPQFVPRVNSAPVGTGNPIPTADAAVLAALQAPVPSGTNVIGAVTTAGSLGTDGSANQPALPTVGSNFSASGPYASYILLITEGVNPSRNYIEIDNTSGSQIAVVRDDGTAAQGAAPVNASVFPLAGGAGVGSQGGSWSSTTFRGRIQIFAPSASAFVNVMKD